MSESDVIWALQYISWSDQQTNTAAGIKAMRQQVFDLYHGDRYLSPNVAILITDGESTV